MPDDEHINPSDNEIALAEKIKKNLSEYQKTVPERYSGDIPNNPVIERYGKNPRTEPVKTNYSPDTEKKSVDQSDQEPLQNGVSSRLDQDLMWLDDPQTLYLKRKLHVTDSPTFVGNLARILSSSCIQDAMKKMKLMADIITSAGNVQYPVFAIDRDGKVIAWNKAMERITSVAARDMVGKGNYAYAVPFYGTARPMLIDRLILPPLRVKNGTGDSAPPDKRAVFISEIERVQIQGKPKLIWAKGTRIYDEEGTIIAAVQSIGIHDPIPPVTPRSEMKKQGTGSDSPFATSYSPPSRNSAASPRETPGSAAEDHAGNGLTGKGIRDRDSTDPFVQKPYENRQDALKLSVATKEAPLRNVKKPSTDSRQLIKSDQNISPKELLEHVIIDAREGIIAYDCDLRCILWNTFMENLTGIPLAEVLGKRAFEMIPALEDAGAVPLLEQALAGETLESSDISFHIPGSGKQAWVRLIFSPLSNSNGNIMGIIGIVQDTTARKVMEYALQSTIMQLMESEEKYRNVFNAKNEPLLLIDTGTRTILDLNSAAVNLYEYTREEMLSISSVDLFTGPEKIEGLFDRQIPGTHMYYQRKKDGTTFPADVSSAFFDLKGRLVLLLSIRDLSSVYQTVDALRLANTKLNLLIGLTRHDIINNLTVLMGYNDLLKQNLSDSRLLEMLEKQESALHTIHRQIEFTREYYDLGVKSPLWQNVRDTATRAYSQFINTKTFTCDTGDLEIYADPLLEKVFYNLFDNAVRYGEGISRIRIYYVREAMDLVLIFGDDGQGIPPENKERIFTRGFGKNTGLGLFLSREILAITRIEISEKGEFEKGARFEFRIPEGSYRFPGSDNPLTVSGSEKMNLLA